MDDFSETASLAKGIYIGLIAGKGAFMSETQCHALAKSSFKMAATFLGVEKVFLQAYFAEGPCRCSAPGMICPSIHCTNVEQPPPDSVDDVQFPDDLEITKA